MGPSEGTENGAVSDTAVVAIAPPAVLSGLSSRLNPKIISLLLASALQKVLLGQCSDAITQLNAIAHNSSRITTEEISYVRALAYARSQQTEQSTQEWMSLVQKSPDGDRVPLYLDFLVNQSRASPKSTAAANPRPEEMNSQIHLSTTDTSLRWHYGNFMHRAPICLKPIRCGTRLSTRSIQPRLCPGDAYDLRWRNG